MPATYHRAAGYRFQLIGMISIVTLSRPVHRAGVKKGMYNVIIALCPSIGVRYIAFMYAMRGDFIIIVEHESLQNSSDACRYRRYVRKIVFTGDMRNSESKPNANTDKIRLKYSSIIHNICTCTADAPLSHRTRTVRCEQTDRRCHRNVYHCVSTLARVKSFACTNENLYPSTRKNCLSVRL